MELLCIVLIIPIILHGCCRPFDWLSLRWFWGYGLTTWILDTQGKSWSWRNSVNISIWGRGTEKVNSLRPRQHGRHFADDIFQWIFLNENVWIPIKISLKFVPEGSMNDIPALVQIMAWRRPGDKPLSEPMLVSLPTHICVTWPQWDKPKYTLLQLHGVWV